jgi:hypothetical protein
MKKYQIKKERPTLKTAHDFYKEGHFTFDPKKHLLSGNERKQEIERVIESLRDIFKTQFPRTNILEYAILKSHLILEYVLVQYIRCFATVAVDEKEIRFSFLQKLEIAYLLGFGSHSPILLPTIECLNRVRIKSRTNLLSIEC